MSIIYGVKKFHKYIYRWKFSLITDHKPLLVILGPKAAIPTLAALRMPSDVFPSGDRQPFKMARSGANVINLSSLTIVVLRDLFAAYGIPEEVVSNNRPQVVSAEFTGFLKEKRIKHT